MNAGLKNGDLKKLKNCRNKKLYVHLYINIIIMYINCWIVKYTENATFFNQLFPVIIILTLLQLSWQNKQKQNS